MATTLTTSKLATECTKPSDGIVYSTNHQFCYQADDATEESNVDIVGDYQPPGVAEKNDDPMDSDFEYDKDADGEVDDLSDAVDDLALGKAPGVNSTVGSVPPSRERADRAFERVHSPSKPADREPGSSSSPSVRANPTQVVSAAVRLGAKLGKRQAEAKWSAGMRRAMNKVAAEHEAYFAGRVRCHGPSDGEGCPYFGLLKNRQTQVRGTCSGCHKQELRRAEAAELKRLLMESAGAEDSVYQEEYAKLRREELALEVRETRARIAAQHREKLAEKRRRVQQKTAAAAARMSSI